jgi:predicted house-cleaning noncanonical NTP pyrophosphatase (MazG superfamily)
MGAKLVRDRNEATSRKLGVSGHWYVATPEEALAALRRKLAEEVFEFLENDNVAELWDVSDVVEELLRRLDPTYASLNAHTDKIAQQGHFHLGIMWNPVPQRGGNDEAAST